MSKRKTILVVGASGMLGNAVIRVLSNNPNWRVYGTLRSEGSKRFFARAVAEHLIAGVDVYQQDALVGVFSAVHPDVVINCVGIIKQRANSEDPLVAIPLNTLLPHRLARLCEFIGARLIHVSTDCVFSGKRGGYREGDLPDALDVYGRSKVLGEVNYSHAITLRTSIIGHQFEYAYGLIDWFLSQEGQCTGYTRAVFSGLPTVILAEIIRDEVVPRAAMSGLYHVAAEPISKYDLLRLVAEIYGKNIEIIPDDKLEIDRSLNAERFKDATGYTPPQWQAMVKRMHEFARTGE